MVPEDLLDALRLADALFELVDFLEPEALWPDDLRRAALLPCDDFFAPEDLAARLLPDDDRLDLAEDAFDPPPDFRLLLLPLDDFPPPNPTARVAAPATWLAARFASATFCGFFAALPASAPITPPTTAPIGPAMLPTTAPAAAPAWVFEIGGTLRFSEEPEDALPEDWSFF